MLVHEAASGPELGKRMMNHLYTCYDVYYIGLHHPWGNLILRSAVSLHGEMHRVESI